MYCTVILRLSVYLLLSCHLIPVQSQSLPGPVRKAFRDADIPLSAIGVYVRNVAASKPLVSRRAHQPMSPASVMKLVTTYAALELLGPSYTFKTETYGAPLEGDVVPGDLILKGHGDPKLTLEDFWLMLRALRLRGVREIRGDLVLDNTYFDLPRTDPSGFDNNGYRAYNTHPEATMVNFKAVTIRFVPDVTGRALRVYADPDLSEIRIINEVKLEAGSCPEHWREQVAKDIQGSASSVTVKFTGNYSSACGEKAIELSLLGNAEYIAATFRQLWSQLGGSFAGTVRNGEAIRGEQPLLVWSSPPLGELVRDINKWSNNVMARQLFLALGPQIPGLAGTPAGGNAAIRNWLNGKNLQFAELVLENGSGLSRVERISAEHLGDLLVLAARSAVMPEFMASLPIAAADGTMKKRLKNTLIAGQAHIKTGTLDGVKAMGGYVLAKSGRRFAVVCMVNHAQAQAAEGPMDALLSWIHERN